MNSSEDQVVDEKTQSEEIEEFGDEDHRNPEQVSVLPEPELQTQVLDCLRHAVENGSLQTVLSASSVAPQEAETQESQAASSSTSSHYLSRLRSLPTSSGVAFLVAASWSQVSTTDPLFVVILAVLAMIALLFGIVKLHIRAFTKPDVFVFFPKAFCQRDFLRKRCLVEALLDMWSCFSVLGSVLFLILMARLIPDISPYSNSQAVENLLLQSFPAGVELQIRDGSLHMSSPHELHTFIPNVLFQYVGHNLNDVGVERVGSHDFTLAYTFWQTFIFTPFFDEATDPFVRSTQFSIGEEVEVLLHDQLFACGAQSRVLSLPVGGSWLRAKVTSIHPSSSLTKFKYTVCLEDETDANVSSCTDLASSEIMETSLQSTRNCTVAADTIRRPHRVVFLPAGESLQHSELQDKRALLIFEESRFAVLEGYSYHHEQHWQWITDKKARGHSATLWHKYDDIKYHSYSVLRAAVEFFCEDVADNGMTCSQSIGRKHYEYILAEVPGATTLLYFNLHLPLMLFCTWIIFTVSGIVVSTIEIFLICWPVGYIASLMFRHVDTPLVPILRVLCISMYSTRVPRVIRRVLTALSQIWGIDGHLHPAIQAVVTWERAYNIRLLFAWALWNSYLVIRMRESISLEEHSQRVRAHSRSTPPSDGRSTAPSDEIGVPVASANEAEETGPKADDDSSLAQASVCRICYGGTEVGRLFSPCLCNGSMRFVHLECLNMWRLSSANPSSFYKCDQCHYRYSFQRTLYASVLRSAIVLHFLTLMIFVLAVIACSYIALCLDIAFGVEGAGAMKNVSDELFFDQLANETGKGAEALRETLMEFGNMQWNGIHLVHFMGGMMMVGIGGFISLGFFPIGGGFFFGGPRHRDVGGPFLIILVIGTIRVLIGIYGLMRRVSGKLLRSAENMILDVGSGAAPVEQPAKAKEPEKTDAKETATSGDGAPRDDVVPDVIDDNEAKMPLATDTTGDINEASKDEPPSVDGQSFNEEAERI